uniref:Uncharacterized protein n=1 Tax=Arundo donax TaxID=35708 RepID=A0A0A8YU42_ARUDO
MRYAPNELTLTQGSNNHFNRFGRA